MALHCRRPARRIRDLSESLRAYQHQLCDCKLPPELSSRPTPTSPSELLTDPQCLACYHSPPSVAGVTAVLALSPEFLPSIVQEPGQRETPEPRSQAQQRPQSSALSRVQSWLRQLAMTRLAAKHLSLSAVSHSLLRVRQQPPDSVAPDIESDCGAR